MPKVRHDFFSDPKWPVPDQTPHFPSACSPSSENTTKDQEKASSPPEPVTLDQTLFELNAKPILVSEPIDKLKASSEEGEPLQCDSEQMALKARELLQQIYMESGSNEGQVVLKVEEKQFSDAEDASNQSFYFTLNHYRILSKETKQFLIDEVERTSLTYVSRKYGISPNNLYRWKKHCERKAGAGRKVADMEMEERLIWWIKGELAKLRENITRKEIQNRAIMYSRDPSFKASKGWFQRFVKRNKQLQLAQYFGMKSNKTQSFHQVLKQMMGDRCGEVSTGKEEMEVKAMHTTRNSQRLSELMLKEVVD